MKAVTFLNRSAVATALLATGLAVQLPRAASAQDYTIEYGQGQTVYSFVNVGTGPATVVAQYYPEGGNNPIFTHTYNNVGVNARIDVVLGSPDALVPSPWLGSVVLSADQDIVAVAATDYTNKGTPGNGYGTEMVMYGAFNEGSTILYAPQLMRISDVNLTASRMTIQNTTASPATVYVTFYYGGSSVARLPISLNPYGSVTLRTNVAADITPANWTGVASAVITATQPIVGFVERHWDVVSQNQNWAAGYALLSPADAGTVLYSPAMFRNCVGGNCILGLASSFNVYSTLFIQNTTPNPNPITVTVINRVTGLPLVNQIFQILPPFGTYLMNPFNNDNNPGGPLNPLYAEMGGQFTGSAVISASAPIVGVGFIFNPQATTVQNTAGGYKLMSSAGASSVVIGPRFARICTFCNNFNNIDDFTQFGNAQIINVGPAPVTLSEIRFINGDGTTRFTIDSSNAATYFLPGQGLTLQPGASIAINTRTGGSLDRGSTGVDSPKLNTIFGNDFNGSIRVTAPPGSQIKAIVTVTRRASHSDVYNAFNR
jgi:hypothetical protein